MFGTGEEKGKMVKILEAKEGESKSSLDKRLRSKLTISTKAENKKLLNDVEENIR